YPKKQKPQGAFSKNSQKFSRFHFFLLLFSKRRPFSPSSVLAYSSHITQLIVFQREVLPNFLRVSFRRLGALSFL
ncbi:MAG: hypothetical protein IJZ10_02895, partial [Thermoguttaceae bacterium]|nr:hypothetical protein [Thermoguttaceae bacterium]